MSGSRVLEVKNPATGEVLGNAPVSDKSQVESAVTAARAAQPAWAAKSDDDRKAIIMQVAKVLTDNTPYLAEWITKEQGKAMAGPGSMFEMQACVGWTQVPASLDLPTEVVFEDETRRDELHRKPIGVIGAIAPWNWPLMIAVWQIIPSLRVGNTVVLKPSEYTTIGTLEMIRLMNTVLPPGVLNSVSVLPGTDMQSKAGDLFWGSFINQGQTCACAKRLYVHENDYDSVVGALDAVAGQMKMGNGMDEGVVLGPVQNQFGPVLPIIKYKTVDEAIQKANDTRTGLGGSVWGDDLEAAAKVASRIESGTVWINQHGAIHPMVPFGGVKDSGYGVEFGVEGLKAVTQPQIISIKKFAQTES